MVTLLPGGGGDIGGWGGSSVGIAWGVPVWSGAVGIGSNVPSPVGLGDADTGVTDPGGVWDGRGVGVDGPG